MAKKGMEREERGREGKERREVDGEGKEYLTH